MLVTRTEKERTPQAYGVCAKTVGKLEKIWEE